MIRRICTARQRLARRDEGTTAVEFALVFPVVAMVCFAALYGALFFFYSAVADHVARSVARKVSIPVGQSGSAYPDATAGTVMTDAKNAAGSLIPDPTSAVATKAPATGTPKQGDFVTVTVTYKLPLFSSLPGLSALDTITRSASERRQ
ncbi:MAG TPA: TadE/TadG family type IV pilus assembly protein [Mycobacteriales bacterium]|jgi:Flp pilus assembly protein TadG|nr:TadE/TadG family type IV pilus assembly protein [Mycobacteriales bacterium]HVX70385.1 TadE/TadG family type IV pilus assembly protein [Mycobacteriales bacterium]